LDVQEQPAAMMALAGLSSLRLVTADNTCHVKTRRYRLSVVDESEREGGRTVVLDGRQLWRAA